MGLLANSRAWLQEQMEGEGQTIRYLRGATVLTFVANADVPDEAGIDAQGTLITYSVRDWCFALAELATLMPPWPAQLDRIQLVIGGVTHQWTVQPTTAGPVYVELDGRFGRVAAHSVYDGVVS